MKNELCFVIEEKKLYMEQILVEYENMPIFYLCSDGKCYYLVLCRNIDEETYIVVMPDLKSISDMLQGKISMREAVTKEKEYWDITAGEDVHHDLVVKRTMDQIPLQDLPYEDSYFQIATKELKVFAERIENELYNDTDWLTLTGNLQEGMKEVFYQTMGCLADEFWNIPIFNCIQSFQSELNLCIQDIADSTRYHSGTEDEITCKTEGIKIPDEKNMNMCEMELDNDLVIAA